MKNSAVIAALFLVVFVAGCKLPGLSYNPFVKLDELTKGEADKSAKSGNLPDDPREAVRAANKKVSELPSFTVNYVNKSVQAVNMKIAYAAPESFHVVNDSSETIIIGKRGYLKNNGKWTKIPSGMGNFGKRMHDVLAQEDMKYVKSVEYIGDEVYEGKNVRGYRSTSQMDDSPLITSEIWISEDSGLPIKGEVKGDSDAIPQTSIVYDYDSPVNIKAPKMK